MPWALKYCFVTYSAHAPKPLSTMVLPSSTFKLSFVIPESLRTKYSMCGASGSLVLAAATILIGWPDWIAEIDSGAIRVPKSSEPLPTWGIIWFASTSPTYFGLMPALSK